MIAARETAAVGSETTQIVSNMIGRIVLYSLTAQPPDRGGYRKNIMFSNQSPMSGYELVIDTNPAVAARMPITEESVSGVTG